MVSLYCEMSTINIGETFWLQKLQQDPLFQFGNLICSDLDVLNTNEIGSSEPSNMICHNTAPSAQGGKSQAKKTGLLVS